MRIFIHENKMCINKMFFYTQNRQQKHEYRV